MKKRNSCLIRRYEYIEKLVENMNRTLLVLEQETRRRERIKQIIDETLEYVTIYTAGTLAEAYQALAVCTIDVFIVNAVLEKESVTDTKGIKFVAQLREIPKYALTPVILISSLADPVLYAFQELNCLGCLNKTFETEELQKLLRKASFYETERNDERTLFLRKNKVLYPVKIKEIVFIKREHDAMCVHLEDGRVLDIPYTTLSGIMQEADSNNLVICSRNSIVNKRYVYALDPTNRFIILRDGLGTLEMGITYCRQLLMEFSNDRAIYNRNGERAK